MKKFLLLGLSFLLVACGNAEETNPKPTNESAEQTAESIFAPTAEVIIDEFFDFSCGHCRDMANDIMPEIKEKYGDQVEVRLHNYPLFPATIYMAEAAACAGEQDKFEAFHDRYFQKFFQRPSQEAVESIAKSENIDLEALNLCLQTGRGKTLVEADKALGNKMGIVGPDGRVGTPYLVLNGEFSLAGALPVDQLSELIDKLIAGEKLE